MANREHIDGLRSLRVAAVAKRRNHVQSSIEIAAANNEPFASTSWFREIAVLQDQIEAIDRAIKDELQILNSTPREGDSGIITGSPEDHGFTVKPAK